MEIEPQEFYQVTTSIESDEGERPDSVEIMEGWQLSSLIETVAEYPEAALSYRLATDQEVYRDNEAIHCPNGY